MPNAKIDLSIGMFGFNMVNVSSHPYAPGSHFPTTLLYPTTTDLLTGYNRMMAYTLKLIQSGKRP